MEVLFKPTKASEVPIRHDYDQAVSYFVGAAAAGDDIGIKEDKGFAINPWTVRCGVDTCDFASRLSRAGGALREQQDDPQRGQRDGHGRILLHDA